jgi:hypothetical protein
MICNKTAALLFACAMPFALAAFSAQAQQPSGKPAAAKKPDKPAAGTKTAAVSGPAGNAQPSLLGQYGGWNAYTASPNGRKVCFALAKPASSQTSPPNRTRDPAFVFVSNRPAEKVKEEVSIIIGYPFKTSSEASVEIGPAKFGMYTQNDGAWIKNAAEEPRLVDAMRKGSDMVIKGTSGHGTQTTDTFSLKGLQQALDRIAQECGK